MGNRFAEIAFTPSVRAVQKLMGSSSHYVKTLEGEPYSVPDKLVGHDCEHGVSSHALKNANSSSFTRCFNVVHIPCGASL